MKILLSRKSPPLTASIELSPVVKPAFKNNQPAASFRDELMKQLMKEIPDSSLLKHLDAILTKHAPKKKNHPGFDCVDRISSPSLFSHIQKVVTKELEKSLKLKKKYLQPAAAQIVVNQFNKCFENAQVEFVKKPQDPIKTPTKPLQPPTKPIQPPPPAPQPPIKSRWTLFSFFAAPFRALSRLVHFIIHKILVK